jgi:hypothetical protein
MLTPFQILFDGVDLDVLTGTHEEVFVGFQILSEELQRFLRRSVENDVHVLVEYAVEEGRHLAEDFADDESEDRTDDQTLPVRFHPTPNLVRVHSTPFQRK